MILQSLFTLLMINNRFVSSSLAPLYRLGVVMSGKKALELAAIEPPDLFIIDVILQGIIINNVINNDY